jgi:hypothetical protein
MQSVAPQNRTTPMSSNGRMNPEVIHPVVSVSHRAIDGTEVGSVHMLRKGKADLDSKDHKRRDHFDVRPIGRRRSRAARRPLDRLRCSKIPAENQFNHAMIRRARQSGPDTRFYADPFRVDVNDSK